MRPADRSHTRAAASPCACPDCYTVKATHQDRATATATLVSRKHWRSKERDVKAKTKRLCGHTQIPELDLFMSLNAIMFGWKNYFRYAHNATNRFMYRTGVVY